MVHTSGPQLRFDKVVVRVRERLQAGLGRVLLPGCAVVITMTAPIRQSAKTAAALEDRIRTLLAGASRRTVRATINGNRIRIGLESSVPAGGSAVLLFVHNPSTDPRMLFEMAHTWITLLRKPNPVLRSKYKYSSRALDAYAHLASELGMPARVKKILVLFSDGREKRLAP